VSYLRNGVAAGSSPAPDRPERRDPTQKVAMRDEEMKSIAELVTSIEDVKASTRDAGWLRQMQTDLAACKTRLDHAVGALEVAKAEVEAGTATPIDVR